MKTVFFAIQIGRDARDLLRTDTLRLVREAGHKVVVVSPSMDDYFLKEFVAHDVTVEPARREQGRWNRLFLRVAEHLYCRARFSRTLDINYGRSRHLSKSWWRRQVVLPFLTGMSWLLPARRLFLRLVRWLNIALWPDCVYTAIFNKHHPDLVVSTGIFANDDTGVLKQAVRRGVPCMAMTPSWDNLTSRTILAVRPDRLIVWNDIVRDQAVRLHAIPARDIDVCGGPQFDMYFRREGIVSRDDFFRKIGADPARKLLTYTTGAPFSMPDEPEVVEALAEMVADDRFAAPCQLLVRLNPRDNLDRYRHLERRPHLNIERAGRPSTAFPDGWDADRADMEHLANLMCHSDVCINVASTIAIDASCFDTPVVNIAFDGRMRRTYYDSVARFYDYTHYRDIVVSGGVKIARSEAELLEMVNAYLKDPSLDGEGRRRILREQCYVTDGTAGKQIAEAVLRFMEKGSGS